MEPRVAATLERHASQVRRPARLEVVHRGRIDVQRSAPDAHRRREVPGHRIADRDQDLPIRICLDWHYNSVPSPQPKPVIPQINALEVDVAPGTFRETTWIGADPEAAICRTASLPCVGC